jgi:hypothetical protein
MTFDLPLDQVNVARLEAMRVDSVREGRQLDYKLVLPGNGDDDKKEFLYDVTSFANAAGGDLIFGVRERKGSDGKGSGEIDTLEGLPGLNVDAERLRLESMMRDGVAPRLPTVTFHEIKRGPEPPCLLLRIPRSWAGLHMVIYKNASRFYSRNSSGKSQLDVHEIRAGFVAAETAYERLRRFRAERIARIIALEAPAPVGEGPKLILHALPIGQSEEVWSRFLTVEESQYAAFLKPMGGHPKTWHFNLDGFVVHTLRQEISRQCYTQVFRDGGVEALSGGSLIRDNSRGGFYPHGIEGLLIETLGRYQKFWEKIGAVPPLLVGIALSGVKGWKLLQGPYDFAEQDGALDRDVVVAPEVLLPDLAAHADVVLRPAFDFIWNGGGKPRSPNYRDGRWVEPKW